LSITEYRQRKKLNNNEKSVSDENLIADESNSSQSPKTLRGRSNSSSSATSGSMTDEEALLCAIPDVKGFNSEPTELERQRESATLRIKKVLGMPVNPDPNKPKTDIEGVLKTDSLSGAIMKETTNEQSINVEIKDENDKIEEDKNKSEISQGETSDLLFYTPDDEEGNEEVESKYLTPTFAEPEVAKSPFGSIEEDVYEGRNPSPPPDLGTANS